MPTSENERVTCPACQKGYRWQPSLVGRSVPCKQCGKAFVIPEQPGAGLSPKAAEDDGLYELAGDPDDQPSPPPAPPVSRAPLTHEPVPPAVSPPLTDEPEIPEQEVYVSDAVKAARREEQRIAAAANESARKLSDYKWLFILLGLLILAIIIYWAMHLFSDAMDKGLHNTLHQDHDASALTASLMLMDTR